MPDLTGPEQLIAAFKAAGFTLKITRAKAPGDVRKVGPWAAGTSYTGNPTYTISLLDGTPLYSDGTVSETITNQADMTEWLAINGFVLGDGPDGNLALLDVPETTEDGELPDSEYFTNSETGERYRRSVTTDSKGITTKGTWVSDTVPATKGGFASYQEAYQWALDNGLVQDAKVQGYDIVVNPSTNRFELQQSKAASQPSLPDQLAAAFARGRESGDFTEYQTLLAASKAPVAPSQPSLDEQIDALLLKDDIEGAQRLYDFQNQMTESQRAQAAVTARDQALRIGQSPGDWWTYYSRLYGNQPSVDFELGRRTIPGYAGGLLGGGQGGPQYLGGGKPQYGMDSLAMDAYQRGLDRQREQRGADGLTNEERIRRAAGLQNPDGTNNNAPGVTLSGTGNFPPALSIGERQRQAPGGAEMDAIDRQIQALLAAGDMAESPEEQAQIQQQMDALQQQRQQIFQRQQSSGAGQGAQPAARGGSVESGRTISDPDNPNMLGIYDKAGQLHWVNRYDQDSINWAQNTGGQPQPQSLEQGNGGTNLGLGGGRVVNAIALKPIPNPNPGDSSQGRYVPSGNGQAWQPYITDESPFQTTPVRLSPGGRQSVESQLVPLGTSGGGQSTFQGAMNDLRGQLGQPVPPAGPWGVKNNPYYSDRPQSNPDNPNMIGVKDATGKVHWVNRNDPDSIEWVQNLGAPQTTQTGTYTDFHGKQRPIRPPGPISQSFVQGIPERRPLPEPFSLGGASGMKWPSRGLSDVSGGGQVSGQRLLTTLGANRFLSPQTERGLMPSERDIYNTEVQNQGFNMPDYLQQKRRQFGGFGGGTAGLGGSIGGGIRGMRPRSLGRR